MNTPVLADLKRGSPAYACIGPAGRFRNFDHAAHAIAGRTYCRLDPVRRQRVLDHAYSPSRFPLGGKTP